MRTVACSLAVATTVAILTLTIPPWCQAQESGSVDTSQFVNHFPLPEAPWEPMRSIYGLADSAFWFGGVTATSPPSGLYGQVWTTLRDLGIRISEKRLGLEEAWALDQWDDLITSCNPDSGERVIASGSEVAAVGWGREVVIHPFDSAPSYYWPCVFRTRVGGVLDSSETQFDHLGAPMAERHYDTTNTTPGATILQRLAFGYDPAFHLRRYPIYPYDENVENSSAFFIRPDLPFGDQHPMVTLWVAVTGHLFEGEPADNSDTLLLVDVYDEIPAGTKYIHDGSVLDSTDEDTELLYATLAYTKAELSPIDPNQPDWDRYRESEKSVYMVRNSDGLGGPFNTGNSAHRMDIRVRWTGKEKLALRSVTLRDSLAHLLFGQDDATYRAKIFGMTDRIMRGPTWQTGQDTLLTQDTLLARRQRVMRFYTGDEGTYMSASCYNWLDSVLYRRYGGGDTRSTYGVRAFRAEAGANPHATTMTSENENSVELYNFENQGHDASISNRFGLPDSLDDVPSLPEHNGGRFHIPTLNLDDGDARSAVDDYSRAYNRLTLREYYRGESVWPWGGGLKEIGNAAWTSRRTGRRLIVWPGVHTRLFARWTFDSVNGTWAIRDTAFSHLPEASQLRCVANLALAYGAHGIHYSWLGSSNNEFYQWRELGHDPGTNHDSVLLEYRSDFGPLPQFMPESMTTSGLTDHAAPFVLEAAGTYPAHRVEIPDFYTGFHERSAELKWLDTWWIPRLWPYLKTLRWRDGYSMHFTVPATWIDGVTDGLDSTLVTARPLPDSEIVTSIRTYDRYGHLDSLIETYVELGLFDTHHGAVPRLDSAFALLVNRRTFERPSDVSDTSARGHLMDSLTEWRRMVVQLHLPRIDTTHYLFVRVRELGPDTTNFPGASGPRAGLDTTLSIDSVFNVWVRPGGAALLEITYRIPEEDLFGILAYNNGRKIVFDGRRYHATYARLEGNRNDSTSYDDRIYYACSYPVASVADQIRWNPIDVAVSFDDIIPDSVRRENRTPSLTVDFSGGDTAAVITWTCHPLDTTTYAGMREAVTRRVRIWDPDGMGANKELGPVTTVAYHDGSYLGLYGTPVVSRLDGGIMVAWSDSTSGIQARFQKRPNGMWWTKQPQQSAAVTVSAMLPGGYADAWFPSMPPFAQVTAGDSNVAITWQQLNPRATGNNIWYRRLEYYQQTGVGPTIRLYPLLRLNEAAGLWGHPSIDQWQCWWWQAYEGVVWEDMTPNRHAIVYRPVATETYDPRGWDSIHTSYAWIPLTIRMAPAGSLYSTIGPGWPSIASLNEVIDAETGDDTTFFAVAVGDSINATTLMASRLLQTQIWFGNSVLRSGYPKTYLYTGYFPHLASSIVRQDLNSATIYQSSHALVGTPTPTIRPTQQFFGRTRPVGGLSGGRQATVRLNDSLETEFSVEFSDPWYAAEDTAALIPMVPGPDSTTMIDSLPQAEDCLRTGQFSTHDSVTIGATILA